MNVTLNIHINEATCQEILKQNNLTVTKANFGGYEKQHHNQFVFVDDIRDAVFINDNFIRVEDYIRDIVEYKLNQLILK